MSASVAVRKELWALLGTIEKFIPPAQLYHLKGNWREMAEVIDRLSKTIKEAPVTYAQDGLGDAAVVHLHYFYGGCDWWITELDMTDGVSQAFGMASLSGIDPDLGYISITELCENPRIELDFYWTPKTVGEIKAKRS